MRRFFSLFLFLEIFFSIFYSLELRIIFAAFLLVMFIIIMWKRSLKILFSTILYLGVLFLLLYLFYKNKEMILNMTVYLFITIVSSILMFHIFKKEEIKHFLFSFPKIKIFTMFGIFYDFFTRYTLKKRKNIKYFFKDLRMDYNNYTTDLISSHLEISQVKVRIFNIVLDCIIIFVLNGGLFLLKKIS